MRDASTCSLTPELPTTRERGKVLRGDAQATRKKKKITSPLEFTTFVVGQSLHTSQTAKLKEPLNQPTRQVGGLRNPAAFAPHLNSSLEWREGLQDKCFTKARNIRSVLQPFAGMPNAEQCCPPRPLGRKGPARPPARAPAACPPGLPSALPARPSDRPTTDASGAEQNCVSWPVEVATAKLNLELFPD